MSQDWRIGFRQAVADMLRQKGDFVESGNYYYGNGWSSHHARPRPWGGGCEVESVDVSQIREESYTYFKGTFDSDGESVVFVAKATCRCGKFKGADFGWSGDLTEALQSLLGES